MDKTEAIRKFCRENINFLSSPQATNKVVTKLRSDFQFKHNLQSWERFTIPDVAHEIVLLYLKAHDTALESFISTMNSIPFIKETIHKEDLEFRYQSKKKQSDSVIKPEELGKISQEEFIGRLEEILKRQAQTRAREEILAEQEELARLRNQIEEEKRQLEKFQSDLDSILPSTSAKELVRQLPPAQPSVTSADSLSWYREIGLTGDPFPNFTGLETFPKEKYDDIIVITPFFQKYVREVNSDPEMLLGKAILISGEFGSGKSTLLEYIAATAGSHGITPIEVKFVIFDPVENLTKALLIKMCDSLSTLYLSRFGEDPRKELLNLDLQSLTGNLLKSLQPQTGSSGFIVTVDGLHKESLEFKPVFNFMKQLQNVQEYFSGLGIKLGFLVAGSPLWDRELEQSPSLSGSFYRSDTIPPLTENFAVEAVQRRIKAYSSNSVLAPTIDVQGLRRSYQILSQRLQRPLVIRDFLKDISRRLGERAFSEVGIVVTLHIETVEGVQAIMFGLNIGRKVKALLEEIGDEIAMREACRNSLVGILEKGGISEQGTLYHESRPAFFLLRKHNLISQRRVNGPDTFEWTLSPELKKAVVDIAQRLSISARTVIRATFEEVKRARRSESEVLYDQPRQMLASFIPAWKDQWPKLVDPLEKCLKLLTEIVESTQQAQWRSVDETHFAKPIELLLRSLCEVALGDLRADIDFVTEYSNSWLAPENIRQILSFSKEAFHLPINETEFYGRLTDHNAIIVQLLTDLREYLQGESICRLSGRLLSSEEFLAVNNLRQMFFQFAYTQVVDGSCELLETRIRANCFVGLRAAWGNSAFDRLPKDVRESVIKLSDRGHPRTKRSLDENFLYDVSRSEYVKILSEGSISKILFGDILSKVERQKFNESLGLAFSLDDRRAHRDRGTYFSTKATEIADILRDLPRLLEVFHSMVERFLVQADVIYTHVGKDYIEAQFLQSLSKFVKTSKIRIDGKESQNLLWLYFSWLEDGARMIGDLSAIRVSRSYNPETELIILRLLLRGGYVSVSDLSRKRTCLELTPKGREAASKSETHEAFI